MDETHVCQDNISATFLEVYGKESSSRRTRHMNTRYFFITDRIATGKVTIKHCPADKMLADPFTKPLQGKEFRAMRALTMNVDISIPDCEMSWDRADLVKQGLADLRPQECVGRLPEILHDSVAAAA